MARRFFKIYADVMCLSGVSWVDKAIYSVIESFHENKGCYASNSTLASLCGVTSRTVINSINRMKKRGAIDVKYMDLDNKEYRQITPLGSERLSLVKNFHPVKSVHQTSEKDSERGVKDVHPIIEKNTRLNNRVNPRFPNSKLSSKNSWDWRVVTKLFPSVTYEEFRAIADKGRVKYEQRDPDARAAYVSELLEELENEKERSSNGEDS